MKLLIPLSILFFTLNLFGQTSFNAENFNVTRGDLETNTFEKDSTANALIIKEYGESHVDEETFDLVFSKRVKLKILNRNGFDNANISIYLYNSDSKKEKIKDIFATTYNNEDGKISKVKLEEDQIFKERYNESYTIVKFTMPDVNEGSVISYSYKLISPFMYKYMPWNFQSDIPKVYSEYKTSIPGNYEYNIKLVGDLKLFVNDIYLKRNCLSIGNGSSADCTESRYVMKDIPSFIEEDYMTTKNNYLSRIEYELKVFNSFDGSTDKITKTWKSADKKLKYDSNIGRKLKKQSVVKDVLPESIININNPLEKAKAIYNFVQNNYVWNKKYNIFSDISIKNLVKTGSGNVSEINFLLFNLLKANDIDVNSILLSTRNNGLPTKIFPIISDFNYVVLQAKINENTYQLDATNPYLSFGQLPFRALNQYGRLLDFDNGSSWVDLKPISGSSKRYSSKFNLNNEGVISGKFNHEASGYKSLELKPNYFDNPSEYIKNYKIGKNEITVLNHEVTINEKSSPVFSEEIELESIVEIIDGSLYINPFTKTFFNSNPFKLQERTYPIDFGYSDSYLYSYKLNFDSEMYKIESIPENFVSKLPNKTGSIIFSTNKNENSITLFFKFNFNEAIYSPGYYKYLKEFFSKIIDIQKNTLLVLKKNN